MNTSKTQDLKLFRINTYKKTGGGAPPPCAGMTEGEERSLHCGRDDRPSEGTISRLLGSFRSGAGSWDYKTIQTQRRSLWRRHQTRSNGAGHDVVEGFLEALHFGLGADGDANVRRPHRPRAADEDILGGHGGNDFFRGAFGVEHEAIGLRGNKGVTVL